MTVAPQGYLIPLRLSHAKDKNAVAPPRIPLSKTHARVRADAGDGFMTGRARLWML